MGFRSVEISAQVFTLRSLQVEREHQFVARVPIFLPQQRKACSEKRYSSLVSGRGFRSAPCTQVEFSQTKALGVVDDQRVSQVQMVDNIEYPLLRGPRVPSIAHQAAEGQMNELFTIIWNQGVGRLLNAVVQKRVSGKFFVRFGLFTQKQAFTDSLRQLNGRGAGILLA